MPFDCEDKEESKRQYLGVFKNDATQVLAPSSNKHTFITYSLLLSSQAVTSFIVDPQISNSNYS